MRFGSLYVCCFLAFATHAVADDKANEIIVVDKACSERKLAACIMEAPFELKGFNSALLSCPGGITETGRGIKQGELAITVTCKVTDPKTVFSKPTFQEEYARCKILTDNFPSVYGENCLKPRTDERQLSTLSSILSQIEKHLCTNADGSKCDEMNKVPD